MDGSVEGRWSVGQRNWKNSESDGSDEEMERKVVEEMESDRRLSHTAVG